MGQNAQLICVDIYIMVCGGGTFWLHTETTAVYWIGVNKIPPNFDTLLAISLEGLRLFKRLNALRVYESFGVTGLKSSLSGHWMAVY
jgi:predicted nuclease with RNAse H fold